MNITLNGKPIETRAQTLEELICEQRFSGAVATALNECFVPAVRRGVQGLSEGDRVEVLAPMQGG
jgi:sulfur carrier protein